MEIRSERVIELIREMDRVLILTHKSPDGDTLGCGTALCRLLLSMGKQARVENSDEIPAKYDYLFEGIPELDFVPEFVVAVDVADPKLLGSKLEPYADKVDLCIDHHVSNVMYAKETFLRGDDGAACLTLYRIFKEMGADITPAIANSLYTGLSTDTGCFRYSNASAEAYRAAADLIELGADNTKINTAMFETKSLGYFKLLQKVLSGLRMYCDNQVAVFKVTQEMLREVGATEDAWDAIAPLSRQIEGVVLGVTMKETKDGKYKFSLRSHEGFDACAAANRLGGGGHARAAGTGLLEDEEAALQVLLQYAAEQLHCEIE